jgi:HEAT repeat protein
MAAQVLARVGGAAAPAVPALIRALSDWSPPVRRSAAQALGAVGPAAGHAIPSLLGLLADYDDEARAAAVAALGGVGEAAVPLLVQVLQERDLRRAGERTRFREEVDRLWRRLEAEQPHRVPDRAWRNLAWAAREGLRECTEIVHQGAALALGRVGPAAAPAVPVLVQALSDESHLVRLAAARALGEIGPGARAALPPLAAALVNGTPPLRKAAAEALPRIDEDWRGGGEVLPALVARLKEDGPRAVEASEALALIGAEAAPVLARALASEDRTVREAAARTLGRIGPAARFAVPALTAALHDPGGGVREAAAQALAKVAPESARG